MIKALKARGAAVQSAFYPAAGHGFTQSADSIDFMKRVEAFLEVHNPADGVAPKGPREPQLVAGKVAPPAPEGSRSKVGAKAAMELRYRVTADGRVTSCLVSVPSGSSDIDRRACEVAEQQLQYRPALDPDGRPKEAWVTYGIAPEPAKAK
jgi:TonB family protein